MDRISGRRFENEPKLNMKKVFATIVAIIVVIMVIKSFINLFGKDDKAITSMKIPMKYFTVFENEKYGVIDGTGNYIIKPTYDEMIIIPDNTKPIFVCVYDVDYTTETYKTKVLNENNIEIFRKYSNVFPIENSNKKEFWYEDNVLKYEKDGKYGLIDFNGKEILSAEYDNIYGLDGIKKSIVVEKDGLKGIVNSSLGNLVVECNYNNITTLSNDNAENGYIVEKDGKNGIVNGTGKEVLACNYEEIKNVTGNDMFVVKDETGLKLIDSNSNIIKDSGFDNISEIAGEYIVFESNQLKGIMKKDGTELISAKYNDLKFACENYFIAKNENNYGIISVDDTVVLDFGYDSINFIKTANFYTAEKSDFTTDIISRNFEVKISSVIISELNLDKAYMRIRKDGKYKYYNFNFEEKNNTEILLNNTLFLVNKDGKYGYVNKNGDLVVNYIYDDAKEQNEFGYCVVKQNGVWGVLGKDGTIVLKPSVNIDENMYIDFISSWHLYNDSNLLLYVK